MLTRLINAIATASALLLLAVTLLVFTSVVLRFLFNAPIADTHDLGRLVLGIALMNGIGLATYYGQQISMDTLWLVAGPRGRRLIDLSATLLTLIVIATITWLLFSRLAAVIESGEETFDLRLPIWWFYGLTALSAAGATLLCMARLWALWRRQPIPSPHAGAAHD